MVEAGMKSKKSYEKMLMDGKLKNAKQELYWDMFLFCIFTGLSFSDMRNLKEENIVTYLDDHQPTKDQRLLYCDPTEYRLKPLALSLVIRTFPRLKFMRKSPRKSGWEILKKCEPCRETGAEGGRVERL